MTGSLVSIIIPTFNRAHLIAETLDSIVNQSYLNWECIVIDDGSNDNTSEILKSYIKRDKRFSYYHRSKKYKKGPSGCRNYGYVLSKGDYVNWLDSDDIMDSTKLETEVSILEENYFYDFSISQSQYFNYKGEKMSYWNHKMYSEDPLNDFIMLKIGWSVNSPLWRKKSLEKHKLLFDERLFNGDDYFFHIKALSMNLKPIILNKVHSLIRIHPDRIEEVNYKAYSKSLIVIHLLRNKIKYNLSDDCINLLRASSVRLLKNMYKNNKLIHGITFSKKIISLKDKKISVKSIVLAFVIGLFYSITGKGYSFFNRV